jgi:hypothetical protein
MRLPVALGLGLAVVALLGVAVASPGTHLIAPGGPTTGALTARGANLVLTWKNQSPLGFSATPCFNAGANSAMCNATYWVNKDPNGACNLNGTAQSVRNLEYTVTTAFYFASASPVFP